MDKVEAISIAAEVMDKRIAILELAMEKLDKASHIAHGDRELTKYWHIVSQQEDASMEYWKLVKATRVLAAMAVLED